MYQPTLGRFLSRDPLSENGVDVLTDTGFYSDRLAAMSASPWFYGGNRTQPYVYARNNPVRYVDPSGLKEVCGFYVWLYSGVGWCVEENVYQAALETAAGVVNCWWNCEVTTHKCVAGKILTVTEAVTGSISVAASRVPKNPTKFLTGFGKITPRSGFFGSTPYTSISRLLGRVIGAEELGKAFGRAKVVALAKGAFVVTAVVEAGVSITCGWRCRQ